ncbi:hypothetical protein BN1708_001654 [Verticillium longisporum]|uniref:chitinase n=1 Tax=Verticillium longisporum TaxID=100787 RepID=A0A0G4MYK9_VERLO|nr:hypothetical protein BN1708_001654 [Verticillium longisporum]
MWSSLATPAFVLLATLSQNALAQVTSDCNPINETDCAPNPALGMAHTFNFNATPSKDLWETHVGPISFSDKDGAAFTITKQGDSPTLRSHFYFFGGRTEIILKAAAGKGIISSVMWLSDTLDEVDWEFVGVNSTTALSNYFGKGKEIFTEGKDHPVAGAPVWDDFHNYTTTWTEDRLEWFIDGQSVRVLNRADALEGGNLFPQTPMRLYLGIWAGGDPRLPKGTRDWAGGDTEYDKGPFTMHVQKAHVQDYSTGKEYVYGDKSGSWQSIQVVEGNSTVKETLLATPDKSIGEKFDELPQGAKIAVYAGGAGVAAILVFALIFYIIRQRRRGARESADAAKRAEAERVELDGYKKSGINPDGFSGPTGMEYNARSIGKDGSFREESYEMPVTAASPLHSSGLPEKGWDSTSYGGAAGAGAAAGAAVDSAAAMRSPTAPLLGHNDHQMSPRMHSPAPYSDSTSPHGQQFRSPLRTPSPGMPPQGPLPMSPNRSVSTPQQFGNQRMGSPAPPQPNRSFSSNQYGDGTDQSYWNNTGYR